MSETIPLFPLKMVLLPGVRIPLHIFEDRYKLMTKECVDADSEFGLMMGVDDEFETVGCAARVTDVINTFTDGRMNIIVEGTDRIRLIERHDDQAYISGTVERLPDLEEEMNAVLVEKTRALYVEALKLSIGWYRAPKRAGEAVGLLSYTIASALGMPEDRQQLLLEETSVNRRYELLKETLESTLTGLREHAHRVSGNGKAHRGP